MKLMVTGVVSPAASRAVTTSVLLPSAPVRALLNAPLVTVMDPTSVPLSLAVTVTGLDVASLVVPSSVIDLVFVIRPLAGDVMFSEGEQYLP